MYPMPNVPHAIGIIAGRGAYPLMLAESARQQGVQRLVAIAFRKETRPEIDSLYGPFHIL